MDDTSVSGNYYDILSNGGLFEIRIDPDSVQTSSGFVIDIDGTECLRLSSAGDLMINTTSSGVANQDSVYIDASIV